MPWSWPLGCLVTWLSTCHLQLSLLLAFLPNGIIMHCYQPSKVHLYHPRPRTMFPLRVPMLGVRKCPHFVSAFKDVATGQKDPLSKALLSNSFAGSPWQAPPGWCHTCVGSVGRKANKEEVLVSPSTHASPHVTTFHAQICNRSDGNLERGVFKKDQSQCFSRPMKFVHWR